MFEVERRIHNTADPKLTFSDYYGKKIVYILINFTIFDLNTLILYSININNYK